MNKIIETTSAIRDHATIAWSIHTPGGGAPGRKLRNGTIANNMAVYQVAYAGINFLFTRSVSMETKSAMAGRLIRITQRSKPKTRGLLALCRVIDTSSCCPVDCVAGPLRVLRMSQPFSDPSTSTRAGWNWRAVPVPTSTSALIVWVAYESNGQVSVLPSVAIVVLSCEGVLPCGYGKSSRSLCGYNLTEISVLSTPKRSSISES